MMAKYRKKKLGLGYVLVLSLALLMGSVLLAAECLIPPTLTQVDIPFTINIALAPARIIDWAEVDINTAIVWDIYGCDADDDPITMTVISMPTGATYDGRWFRWTPKKADIGVHYLAFKVTDDPGEGLTPGTDVGCYVVNVKRMSNAKPNINKRK